MTEKPNNFAFIDGANLHNGVRSLGWELDYARFRIWLKEKYKVNTAYLFIGLISKYAELYKSLQEARTGVKISYIGDQRSILEDKKSPRRRRTP